MKIKILFGAIIIAFLSSSIFAVAIPHDPYRVRVYNGMSGEYLGGCINV